MPLYRAAFAAIWIWRWAPTRAKAFEAARDLAIEALAREADQRWLRFEIVLIRVEADPGTRPLAEMTDADWEIALGTRVSKRSE